MSALFLPPRNGQSFALCSSSRDVRPGSYRHLEMIEPSRQQHVNRIEAFLPATAPVSSFTPPSVTLVRVPGTAPLKEIVSRIVAKRSTAALAHAS